jgi:hypothetical protein
LLGLSGGAAAADVYHIDLASTSAYFETAVPVWRNLKSAASTDNVSTLAIPDQNPWCVGSVSNKFF